MKWPLIIVLLAVVGLTSLVSQVEGGKDIFDWAWSIHKQRTVSNAVASLEQLQKDHSDLAGQVRTIAQQLETTTKVLERLSSVLEKTSATTTANQDQSHQNA